MVWRGPRSPKHIAIMSFLRSCLSPLSLLLGQVPCGDCEVRTDSNRQQGEGLRCELSAKPLECRKRGCNERGCLQTQTNADKLAQMQTNAEVRLSDMGPKSHWHARKRERMQANANAKIKELPPPPLRTPFAAAQKKRTGGGLPDVDSSVPICPLVLSFLGIAWFVQEISPIFREFPDLPFSFFSAHGKDLQWTFLKGSFPDRWKPPWLGKPLGLPSLKQGKFALKVCLKRKGYESRETLAKKYRQQC